MVTSVPNRLVNTRCDCIPLSPFAPRKYFLLLRQRIHVNAHYLTFNTVKFNHDK
uniref:Uncharacterized protein n=1 Tax=Anguilla anguilla TaxID=7936 RepID=A0A0E9W9V2_ANGAN